MLTLMTPDGVMVIPMTMLEIIWADYGDGGCDVDDDDEVVRKALVFELWLREPHCNWMVYVPSNFTVSFGLCSQS